jgi:hypothetical protein
VVTLDQAYHEPGNPDDKYNIQQMTTCSPTFAQSIICSGDIIRLHTQYTNNSGFPILDAMGIITAAVNTNLPDTNGNGTIDVCDDTDGDGVKNAHDTCPNWANASQALPNWPIPSGDADCDGFPGTVGVANVAPETTVGTSPTAHCSATGVANDEPDPDAWPMDFNDNRIVNGQDVAKFAPAYNKSVSAGPFGGLPGVRFDYTGNNIINGQDVAKFSPFYNKACT